MNLIIIFPMLGLFSIALSSPTKDSQENENIADNFQAKRDLSLSYAATDIGSKEGTRVKTITVIKNVVGKKEKPIKIDPKLHKDENWGSHFRDNFDAYGAIPDVPDIDELFDFVNKKEDKKPKDEKPSVEEVDKKNEESDEGESEQESTSGETTILPAPVEEVVNEEKVEKIEGDAELIETGGKRNKTKSQSLKLGKYSVKESTNEHYQPLQQNVANRNEKYIQSASGPYYYPEPSYQSNSNNLSPTNVYLNQQKQKGRGSVSVSTPSGKTFDVPINNGTDSTPYIAPTFRRNQNSSPGLQIVSSSQRPYIAPNVRKGYEVQLTNPDSKNCTTGSNDFNSNTPQTNLFNYPEIPANFRANRIGVLKQNVPRSRGLRY